MNGYEYAAIIVAMGWFAALVLWGIGKMFEGMNKK